MTLHALLWRPQGRGPFPAILFNHGSGCTREDSATARKCVGNVAHNKDFRFTAKLFHSFTHERKPATNDERDFKAGIAPIAEGDRLGAILIQIPWSFKNELKNREYLWQLQTRFHEYPLVVEVRHSSWITDDVLDTFLRTRNWLL